MGKPRILLRKPPGRKHIERRDDQRLDDGIDRIQMAARLDYIIGAFGELPLLVGFDPVIHI